MNPMAKQLSQLKFALQELESAVQKPREDRFSIEYVLGSFPAVMASIERVLKFTLANSGFETDHPFEMLAEAHHRGWLSGDLSLWIRLSSDYQQLQEEETHGARSKAIAQDIRACSAMLWETYELLTSRFIWQTQIQHAPHLTSDNLSQQLSA